MRRLVDWYNVRIYGAEVSIIEQLPSVLIGTGGPLGFRLLLIESSLLWLDN